MRYTTTGASNSAFGYGSLFDNIGGSSNSAFGYGALGGNTTGTYNVGIGAFAGDTLPDGVTYNTTSDNSIFIGYATSPSSSNGQNEIVIGDQAKGNGSNSVTLGNTSITQTILRPTVKIQGSGSTLLHVSGSGGNLFSIVDSGSNFPTIATFSSGSVNVLTVTTSSVQTTGQLKLNSYTTTTSFTGTPVGFLGFDSSGNILTTTGSAAGGGGSGTSGSSGTSGANGTSGSSGSSGTSGSSGSAGTSGANGASVTGQIILTAGGGWPSITAGAQSPTLTATATNAVNFYSINFADGSQTFANWAMPMPSDYNGGTITAVFYWMSNNASTNSVVWGFQGRAYADSDLIDQAFGTAQTVTDANQATRDVNISAATAAITLGGTPAASNFVQFRCYRDGAAGGDTLAATAELLAIRITYTRA
jgi:hypothetical protein